MFKFFSSFAFLFGLLASAVIAQPLNQQEIDSLDNMPIMEKIPVGWAGATPIEQRGPEFRKFLAASVKIGLRGSSGSGTIVYYDPAKNLAYVASCGHMWPRGTMSAEEGKRKNLTCKVIIWYQNDKKLETTRSYDANVIFYSYVDGADTSLITFKPDWVPEYFPIAPVDYKYEAGKHAHSLGCDGGNEVAHYDIEMIGLSGGDLVTTRNSPRPGRSGGGLMDENGYYIATCWGTQYRDGSGKGYFTPLSAIHRYWGQQKDYSFLLSIKPGGGVRNIPIKDRNVAQGTYTPEYILLPNGR